MKTLRLMMVWLLIAAMSLGAAGAWADVLLTNGSQTAYVGADDYLYLVAKEGGSKVMRTPITDIVAMNESILYCVANGALYSVRLDGTSSSIVANQPTEELLASLRPLPYTLQEGALTYTADGADVAIAPANVLMATANDRAVFYLETTEQGIMLKSFATVVDPTALETSVLIGPAMVMNPIALVASENAVVILGQSGMAALVNLTTGTYRFLTFPQTDIARVAVLEDQVLYYTQDEAGVYHYAGQMTENSLATPVPATPVPTATPTPTVKPTPTPTIKPTAEPYENTYAAVKYGNTGSRVYNMQKRLVALGYPVGNVDGSFGAETLLALNLFQGDAGFREQTTATSDLLEVLYSKAAPKYNAYKTRRSGNIGERVQMIQERLNDLGYKAGEEDGVYGKNTVNAVKAFQQDNKLTVDGVAGPATLKKLYASNAASKPTATPAITPKPEVTETPKVTEKPVVTETPKVTQKPEVTPTPVPDTSLALGEQSTAVKALNQRLYELGYLAESQGNQFTTATQTAVNAFAARAGLTANGKATEELQDALYASTAPCAYDALKEADESDAVLALKQRLAELGYLTFDANAATVKVFDTATVAAVDAFAQEIDLSVAGVATPALQVRLYRADAPEKPVTPPTPTAEPDPTPTAEPDPTPTVEPDPTPTAEPDPTPTAEPDPTPTAEPDPTPTVEPDPTPTVEPDPTPTVEPSQEPENTEVE